MIAQGFAALINRNAFLKLDIATLKAANNTFKLFQGALERHFFDVGVALCRRLWSSSCRFAFSSHPGSLAALTDATSPPVSIRVLTCTATDLASPVKL